MGQEYEELAVRLGTDADYRLDLRRRLEAKRLTAPLFDTERCRRQRGPSTRRGSTPGAWRTAAGGLPAWRSGFREFPRASRSSWIG